MVLYIGGKAYINILHLSIQLYKLIKFINKEHKKKFGAPVDHNARARGDFSINLFGEESMI